MKEKNESYSTEEPALFSEETILMFTWIVYCFVCQVIGVFGIVTNIINIMCFFKQGFVDSVNVSLLGLSVSDLGCLATMIMINICITPAVRTADLAFDPYAVNYALFAALRFAFSRVSSWITAFVTLERCLSIVSPLKIKSIITPTRATAVIVSVFLVSFCIGAPLFAVNKLGMVYSSTRNKTVLGIVYNKNREHVEKISFVANNLIIPFAAFIIIVVCTIALVINLKRSLKWREKATNQQQAARSSSRNKNVGKMVVMISTLFIVCFLPLNMTMLGAVFVPDLLINGKYLSLGIILGGFSFILESINSSVNIFIYYSMSTRYRRIFHYICGGEVK